MTFLILATSEDTNKRLFYFVLCSLFSVTIQLSIATSSHYGALVNGAGVDALFSWILGSPPLQSALAHFLVVFVVTHFLFYVLLYQIYKAATERLPKQGAQFLYILLFQILAFLSLLAINAQLYPRSLFAWAAQPLLEQSNSEIKLGILFVLFGSLCLLALWRFMRGAVPILWARKWLVALVVVIGGSFYQVGTSRQHDAVASTPDFEQPHVILIGIDSLRPDLINKQLTPHLARIAEESITFSNAYTPLGRTFPAWVSILTGKYPTNHGARFNLTAKDQLDLDHTLAKDLQLAGYTTAFFMDEKRFANIDQDYGFDIVEGPRMGLRDFLLGSMADFPVLNLLRQIPIAKQLLPDSYDNRAVSDLYAPERFDQLLEKHLPKLKSRPLFLAVHFCLPHWPYAWSDIDDYPMPTSPEGFSLNNDYLKAVHRADEQAGWLISQLESQGFLKNAIVIFLSDHPESFSGETPIDAYDPAIGRFALHSSWGHGMSVARPDNSKILLMIKKYGKDGIGAKTVTPTASLIDIRPTILSMLNIVPGNSSDGFPLLPEKRTHIMAERPLFFETGLNLSHIKSANIDKARIIKDGIEYYDIEPDLGRLVLKKSSYSKLVGRKSIAVMKDGWLLSLSLRENTDQKQENRLILTHQEDRQPTDNEAAHLIDTLLPLMCQHYQGDGRVLPICARPTEKTVDNLASY